MRGAVQSKSQNRKSKMKFAGVPSGRLEFTAVPNVIFSELLPLLDDAAALQVTLRLFYLVSQKKGAPRFVTYDELRADETLMRALAYQPQNLQSGLEKATAHGALLRVETDGAAWYFFNAPEGRKTLEKIARGEWGVKENARAAKPPAVETPNIYKLYEQHIGPLNPLIAEELKEAEQDYPPEIILDAFRIAAENNARSWRYVNKILMDWARRNKYEKTRRPATKRRPVVTGKLADVAKPK
ncbi:DnaD domain protein [Anaerolineae bacterium CFX7]|nr:DnaD domain protein [Anaerolineae bacterium CFX7]